MKLRFSTLAFVLLFAFPVFARPNFQDPQCVGIVHGAFLTTTGTPASDVDVVFWPVGVDLSYMLPHKKTGARGEFSFDHICSGRYSVLVSEREAYVSSSPYLFRFLYGHWPAIAKISTNRTEDVLSMTIPPKSAQLQVRAINSKTRATLSKVAVEIRINRKRKLRTYCDEEIPCNRRPFFPVPPDQDVRLRVYSDGFHQWKKNARGGRLIHVPAGEVLTIEVELDPL